MLFNQILLIRHIINIPFQSKSRRTQSRLKYSSYSHKLKSFTKASVSQGIDTFSYGNFCFVDIPCEYPDIVDLRIIVLAYNRPHSLLQVLHSLEELILDGDHAVMEIFIDQLKEQKRVDDSTLSAAKEFLWKQGPTRIHVWQQHVGIYGQWIDSWRPKAGSKEIALILEDDLNVSKYAYRWLKAVHIFFGHQTDIQGYSLQSEGVLTASTIHPRVDLNGPPSDTVFLWKILGTWGFSPHPKTWRMFQDWYHAIKNNRTFRPYVENMIVTKWYKTAEEEGLADGIWEIWHIYFSSINRFYCVYNNLNTFLTTKKACLSVNRKEDGLHYKGKAVNNTKNLLQSWEDKYVEFPKFTTYYNYDGSIINKK